MERKHLQKFPWYKNLSSLAVCLCWYWGWGENSPSLRKRGNLPQDALDIWRREGARPRGIWSGCLALPTPWPQLWSREDPTRGRDGKFHQAGRPGCAAWGEDVATQLNVLVSPVNFQLSGNRTLPFITRKMQGVRGAAPAGRVGLIWMESPLPTVVEAQGASQAQGLPYEPPTLGLSYPQVRPYNCWG